MSTYIRNGNGSAHTHVEWNTWQRHNVLCIARGGLTLKVDPKTGKARKCYKCRGAHANAEMRFHALVTSMFMTNQRILDVNGSAIRLSDIPTMDADDLEGATFVCPITLERLPIADGQADRPLRGADGGRYEPGNVALIAAGANQAREDMAHDSLAYVDAVIDANARARTVRGVTLGNDVTASHKSLVRGRDTRGTTGAEWVALIESGPYPN